MLLLEMVEVVLVLGQPTSTLKIYNFGRDRHEGDFKKFQNYHTEPPMELFRSRDYPVGAFGGSFFGISAVDGKYGVGFRTTKLTYKKLIVGLMVNILCEKGVWSIHP